MAPRKRLKLNDVNVSSDVDFFKVTKDTSIVATPTTSQSAKTSDDDIHEEPSQEVNIDDNEEKRHGSTENDHDSEEDNDNEYIDESYEDHEVETERNLEVNKRSIPPSTYDEPVVESLLSSPGPMKPSKRAKSAEIEIIDLDSDDEIEIIEPEPAKAAETLVDTPTTALIKYTIVTDDSETTGEYSMDVQEPFSTFAESIADNVDNLTIMWKTVVVLLDYTPETLLDEGETTLQLRVFDRSKKISQYQANPSAKSVSAEPEPTMLISINCKDGKSLELQVTPMTIIKNIAAYVRKQKGLAESVAVRLLFDHEELESESTVGTTELEDEDAIDAYY